MNWKALFKELLRVAVALVFLFSGFVKGVDPWGTAIKLGEYFAAFGLDFLIPTQYVGSVLLSGAEMVLGLGLLFHLGRRLFPRLMLLVTVFFTLLTLVLALWNPVSDCGCFGDAIKLTNWQTFWKNVALMVGAVAIWWWDEKQGKIKVSKEFKLIEWSMGMLFVLFAIGVGVYSLRHLPLIDFLPFRVGVHIPTAMNGGQTGEQQTILIYRDKSSGQECEFDLSDTTWHDTLRWEFVDTRFVEIAPSEQPTITEFSLFNADGNVAPGLLASSGAWFLVTLTDPAHLTPACHERLTRLADYAATQGMAILAATSAALSESDTIQGPKLALGAHHIPLYNIDATTLKTVIRTHTGVLLLKEGVLLGKWNCRDIPHFADSPTASRSALSWVATSGDRSTTGWMLGSIVFLLMVLYISYFAHRRND